MRVSYIVPVFNKAVYIPYVLRAALNQQGDFEREIIVVDDGSSDGSADAVRAVQRDFPEIRLIAGADDGPAVAINRAAQEATGTFYKFIDGDDLLLPDCTLNLVHALRDTSAVLATGACRSFKPETLHQLELSPAGDLAARTVDLPLPKVIERIQMTMSGTMVTAEAFHEAGGCDERVFVHDGPLFMRMARLGSFVELDGPVAMMPSEDPNRWSNRAQGQVLHDLNASLLYFLRDHPDVSPKLRRRAAQRATGRAWKYHKRHYSSMRSFGFLLTHLRTRLSLRFDTDAVIQRSLDGFGATIRRPGAQV